MRAPGAYRQSSDRWGTFEARCAALPPGPALAIADERVLRLHPHVERALDARRVQLAPLPAGERTKSLATLEELASAAASVPRSATLLAIGGGTIGDVATVFAHLFKRGVGRFIQVPTTTLAAVDSSVGGKGAVNLPGVKNGLGVFHFADEAWLCPEFFSTLARPQREEGAFEAWKMAVTLDAQAYARWKVTPPPLESLVRQARRLKAAVVRKDPYEASGLRAVLNFGHTFGHLLESVTGYRLRHGQAVGLGMLCALDVGRAMGLTADSVACDVEDAIFHEALGLARRRLQRALSGVPLSRVRAVLAADKKSVGGELRMVLLQRPGAWETMAVSETVWRPLLADWVAGRRP